jgi:hypothetical protein
MSQISVSGSCLCGSISYSATGHSNKFWHCHCGRCRKSSGTGHASNILMRPDRFEWSAGEELLRSFQVPDANVFRTVFCSVCGSPMPRVAPDASFALIPAGSLDNDPGIRPTGRIYQDSRTDWSCDDSELPLYETYPRS